MGEKDNTQDERIKALKLAVAGIITIALVVVVSLCNSNERYRAEIEKLEADIERQDETITELRKSEEFQRTETESLKSVCIRLRDEYEELRLEKSVPIYHCDHKNSEIGAAVYSFLDEMPSELEEERNDDGGYIISSELAEAYSGWYSTFADAVGYWDNLEYEWYLEMTKGN